MYILIKQTEDGEVYASKVCYAMGEGLEWTSNYEDAQTISTSKAMVFITNVIRNMDLSIEEYDETLIINEEDEEDE